MSTSNEDARLASIRELLGVLEGGAASPQVVLGIGDDAAVLTPDGPIVVTVDTHVEDVHFRRAWLTMRELGAKSFMAAASDLAAMGARPLAALSALILPADLRDEDLAELVLGQRDAAQKIACPIVGGNLAKGPLSITTTCIGESRAPLRRGGAKAGDVLLACGAIGCASVGLHLLEKNMHLAHDCVRAWKSPVARIDAGLALSQSGSAHACIDVSDGFALDLHRLCEASNVGADVDEDALVSLGGDALNDGAKLLAAPAIDLALFGGEDYALLASANASVDGFTIIGKFTADRAITLCSREGRSEIPRRGHSHF